MKSILIVFLLVMQVVLLAQPHTSNVFIITIDGVRWQEIFKGADPALLSNERWVADTSLMRQQFGHTDTVERRRRLLPFFWSVLQEEGQLLGNRLHDNKVNVANGFKISYPGYNEIFTGYADSRFIPNTPTKNSNSNVLQYLNQLPELNGRIVAFCSWRLLPYILAEDSAGIPVNAGYENEPATDSINAMINTVQEAVTEKEATRHDLLTFAYAKNYVATHHPKVLYLGLGETDEAAHAGRYDQYLQHLHQADAMIAELWYYVQTDPFYKNNTTFIITTDHGRGNRGNRWKTHGFWVRGSGETWMALLGSGIPAKGEVKEEQQLYQKQVAATVSLLMGYVFTAAHPVAPPLVLVTPGTK